jgi:hypothetical protein
MENWISDILNKAKSHDVILPLAAGATTGVITYVLLKQYYLQPSTEKNDELQRKLDQVRPSKLSFTTVFIQNRRHKKPSKI